MKLGTLALLSSLLPGVAVAQTAAPEQLQTVQASPAQAQAAQQQYLLLMRSAWAHASAHGATAHPFLSPTYASLFAGEVPVDQLHKEGFGVLPGTSSIPDVIRRVIRSGSDGLITDRPDLERSLLVEEAHSLPPQAQPRLLEHFDVQAHRGGRGLRPENTLPSFENGMDLFATTLELDTAITSDGVAVIWHDQFMNPRSCRHKDGSLLPEKDKPMLHEMSFPQIQSTFVCDRLYFGPDQKNDRALSPVASAFARQEGLPDIYTPVSLQQLFRFVKFYRDFYAHGAGAKTPDAARRVTEGDTVRFNIETKLTPLPLPAGRVARTASPQQFVDTLWKTLDSEGMTARAEIQSFDFRTLRLFEEQHPSLPTFYLTSTPERLQQQLDALGR